MVLLLNACIFEEKQNYQEYGFAQSQEEVIQKFLTMFREKTFSENVAWTDSPAFWGMDFKYAKGLFEVQTDAELEQLKKDHERRTFSEYLEWQNLVVEESFGDDAWENVSYDVSLVYNSSEIQGYKDRERGEILTYQQYRRMNAAFLKKKTGDEFISEEELYKKYPDKAESWVAEMPAVKTTLKINGVLRVTLTFDGQKRPEKGFGEFDFYIANYGEQWFIYEGLKGGYFDDAVPKGD